jgi:hypothetical protein
MTLSFQTAKSSLSSAIPLHFPNPSAPISLTTDASNTHIGAVLQQKVNGSWQPLSFFSKKLSQTETRYSTFDRELLAAFLAAKHFRFSSKVVLSQTTSLLFLPSQNNPLLSHLANKDTFHSFQNSMQLFTIFLVIKILWLMHFPDQTFPQSPFLQQHPPPSFLFPSPTQLWPQHNNPMILSIP